MSKDIDRAEALRTELVRALVVEEGMREVVALPLASSILAYLQREHPGERLYIPAPVREYPVDEIRAALRSGDTPAQICRAYGMSRRTLGRILTEQGEQAA